MTPHPFHRRIGRQRNQGAVALAITLLLFFVMALVGTFVSRNLVFEQRISGNQYRSTQAFEAAEAGLQWAEAQLNTNQRLDEACLPSSTAAPTPTADSFRERYLELAPGTGRLVPRARDSSSVTSNASLQPTCVRDAAGWSCSCPSHGDPALVAPTGDGPFPAFSLQFVSSNKPGIVRVVATGCSSLAPPCRSGSAARADATARIEVALALLGGLRLWPAAALTTAGAVDADTAAFSAYNPDPATGIAVHAGSVIAASLAHLGGVAGAELEASRVEGDTALADLGADRYFTSYFGIGKARWQEQPAVTRVVCSVDCAAALGRAIDDRSSSAMLWVDGDLDVQGPAHFGTPARPVVIVVGGAIHFRGAIAIDGVLYAGQIRWDDAGSDAGVRGALISETSYQGSAESTFLYDPAVLATLSGFAGSFARVSGSWRDF